VLSSDAAPYQQAADALNSSLEKQGIYTREYLSVKLSELTPEFLAEIYKTKMWVAIGSRAAAHLHKVLPDTTPPCVLHGCRS